MYTVPSQQDTPVQYFMVLVTQLVSILRQLSDRIRRTIAQKNRRPSNFVAQSELLYPELESMPDITHPFTG
jgi:hypothetical protein